MTRIKKIKSILIWLLAANLAVALAKAIVGYLAGSLGILADAFHSLTDSTNNIVGIIAMSMADHPPDEDHPYGHAKYETLATIIIATLLLIAAYSIIKGAIERFMNPVAPETGWLTFAVMFFTISINIVVATYEYRAGKRLQSDFLIADSYHTRSDIFVSLSVIVSLFLVRLGFPVIDPIISLIIGLFIAKAGYDVLKRSSSALTDKAVLDADELCRTVENIDGVLGCHKIRTRGSAAMIYVDLHLEVDRAMTIEEAHELATEVEDTIIAKVHGVVEVVVHIEPFEAHKA